MTLLKLVPGTASVIGENPNPRCFGSKSIYALSVVSSSLLLYYGAVLILNVSEIGSSILVLFHYAILGVFLVSSMVILTLVLCISIWKKSKTMFEIVTVSWVLHSIGSAILFALVCDRRASQWNRDRDNVIMVAGMLFFSIFFAMACSSWVIFVHRKRINCAFTCKKVVVTVPIPRISARCVIV